MSNQSYTRADAFDAGWPLAMGKPSQPRTYIADLDRLHRGHGRIGMHWPWKMVNVVVRLHSSQVSVKTFANRVSQQVHASLTPVG